MLTYFLKRHYSCLGAGLLTLLTACTSQPAATSPPIVVPQPTASPDTTLVTLGPADSVIVVGDAPEAGDVPALHKPFTHVNDVAPGLQVIVSSVPVAAKAIIREPSDLQLVLTIKKNHRVIFRDTTADGLAYEYSEPQAARLYPLWLPTGPNAGDLLVAYNNRPSKDQARRFRIQNNQVVGIDTLLTFDGPARDVDHDGRLEFAGLYNYGEEWDDEQGRRRQLYNPTLYYEARTTGLALDSALTKQKATAKYGAFYGYEASDKPIIYAKQP
jgi:hypothetical protein